MKKVLLSMIFILSFLFISSAEAVRLKAIETLGIKEANVVYSSDTKTLSGVLKVFNPTREDKSYRVFLSFRSKDTGDELTRIQVVDLQKIKRMQFKKDTFNINNMNLPNGSYEMTLLLDTVGIGISSVKPVGSIKISDSNEQPFVYILKCKVAESGLEAQVPVSCSVSPAIKSSDKLSIAYSVRPVGAAQNFAQDRFEVPNIDTENLEFKLPAGSIDGGAVDVSVQLLGEKGKSNISYFRYFLPGKYSKIVVLKDNKTAQQLELYLNGSLYLKDRRLLVGMLDLDEICFVKDLDLYSIAPLNKEISYKKQNTCKRGAKPFAILYTRDMQADQGAKLNANNILDFKGLQDRASAVSILNSVFKTNGSLLDKLQDFGATSGFVLSLVAITLLIAVIAIVFLFARKKSLIAILFIASAFVPAAFSNAEIFDSLDAPKVRFEVNFPNITKEVGQNDNIIFSFAAIDNFSGGTNKYPGAEVYAWIDNAQDQKVKIMDANDTSPVVIVDLPNNLSLGVHTLNFEVPASTGICGAAYDFSNFDNAVFDPLPCEFSVDFTVVPGSKIALTFYAQPKSVQIGSSSKLYWSSSGADSCVASDGWSGAKALVNMTGQSTGPINTAYKDFTLTCSNGSESITRTDTVYTYICGDDVCSQWEDCNLCSQDCGECDGGGDASSFDITADPQLVREGGVSYITWYSNGYTNCVVTEDNPTINDNWNRLAGVEKTSALNRDTTYTVTCDNNGADTKSKSVKVRIVPKYIEF